MQIKKIQIFLPQVIRFSLESYVRSTNQEFPLLTILLLMSNNYFIHWLDLK